MTRVLRRRALGALGLVVAAWLTLWACSTPVRVGVEAEALGVKLKIAVDSQGNPVAETTGSLPPGKCLEITFSGADGADIQTVVVTVPGHCQVPAGAVRQSFEIVDCPPPAPPAGAAPSGPAPLDLARLHSMPRWREVFSCPIAVTSGTLHGAVCHARVWCTTTDDPVALLRPILAAGPGTAVPPTIEIHLLADLVVGTSGATVRMAAHEPISELRLDWNGLVGFGDLAAGVNTVPRVLGHGWCSVESFIGNDDANDGLGEWNRATLTMRIASHVQPEVYSLGVQNLAF